ncbi:hypothetical protein [Streptomyces sp. SID13726]|uniref:hypothetical protein n=1 Tax=Streptomyces sp. SID13726 TaxID=2706058 RepID=UPI001944E2B5|nr:hypothetical protein [Streptomyces sp. SID13726]
MPTEVPPHPLIRTAIALTALALLALPALTGCHDGQGVRDEGPAKDRAAAVEHQKAARG